MYCTFCGKMIQDDANLCAYCGKSTGNAVRRRLYRPRAGRKIAGVCAGFAEYFDADVTIVRLIWLLAAILTVPFAIIGYIVAWIVMPEEPRPAADSIISAPLNGTWEKPPA